MFAATIGALAFAILGAVIGSFLNVVVYRLPLGLSVSRPRWSFCPECRSGIAWQDNIPILGWLKLRGRCRACGAPIAVRYPIIECVCALLFLMVWDAVSSATPGTAALSGQNVGGVVALCVLFAALLASAAMDIDAYLVDVRVLLLATGAGAACRTLAGPNGLTGGRPVPEAVSILAAAAGIAWLITHFVAKRLTTGPHGPEASEAVDTGPPTETESESHGAEAPPEDRDPRGAPHEPAGAPVPTRESFRPAGAILLVVILAALAAWQAGWGGDGFGVRLGPAEQRGVVAGLVLFFVLVGSSMTPRPSDHEIVQEIEAEMPQARRMAMRELASFLPSMAVGVAGIAYLRHSETFATGWADLLSPVVPITAVVPAAAELLSAVTDAVLAAGLGWTVRILGTLAFGKEAFGTGDIYIMAAIAAAGGFWFMVFAFFIAAMLALVGVLATFWRKRSRAVPFGPWLALGAFASLYATNHLTGFFTPFGQVLWRWVRGVPVFLD